MGGYFIRGRGKWVAVLGAGAMVIAALLGWRWAREEYALWRLRSGSEEEKKRAAQTLSSLRVGRAVPELARVAREHGWEGYELGNFLLGSDFVQDWVLEAFDGFGKEAVFPLLRAIERQPEKHLFFGLACLAPEAGPAVPTLLGLLNHPDPLVRELAIKVLSYQGLSQESDLAPILLRFGDESSAVRQDAVRIVRRFARDRKSVAPELVKLLADKDAGVVIAAADTLIAFREELSKVTAVLLPYLAEKSEGFVNSFAIAAERLGDIGPDAAEAVPLFRRGLSTTRMIAAAYALWRIEGPRSEGREMLLRALRERDKVGLMLFLVLHCIGDLGPAAKEAIPALEDIMSDATVAVERRIQAARALWKVTEDPAKAIPFLVGVLAGDEHWAVRAVWVLDEFGPRARDAIPSLEAMLSRSPWNLRRIVKFALQSIKGESPPHYAEEGLDPFSLKTLLREARH